MSNSTPSNQSIQSVYEERHSRRQFIKYCGMGAVRRKAGEDYFLEEQYRFTRKR